MSLYKNFRFIAFSVFAYYYMRNRLFFCVKGKFNMQMQRKNKKDLELTEIISIFAAE